MAISKRRKKKYLPPEIVTNIFARLPLKALGNVMLVNKFCLKLISSGDFARAHLKYLKQGNTNLSAYKLLFGTSLDGLLKQISFESLLFDSSSINVVDLDYPKNGLRSPAVSFEGSCDGLVCLVLNDKYVFLWIPCTGKYKELPRLYYDFDCEENLLNITYGLGYDESTDDFKVVAIYSKFYKSFPKDWLNYELYVFSLKNNYWVRIHEDLKCNVPEIYSGKLISGSLHWLSGACNENDTRKIVSFDVENEVFGIVEPPSNYKDGCCKMTLDVLEGCICLLISYEERKCVDLWVLKEYGVNESWTKDITISCVSIPDCAVCKVAVLPNGEILFYSSRTFAVYNRKEDSYRHFDIKRLDHYRASPVFYVPSLVSPIV